MIESLHLCGYRSLRDFRVQLGRVTVISGENGTGKSNFYRSLALLQSAARGRLAEAIAREGGMPGLLWAGDRRKNEPRRFSIEVSHSDFDFSLACGLVQADKSSAFRTDPDIKEEVLRLGGPKGRVVAHRTGSLVKIRSGSGALEPLPLPFHSPESILSEIRDGSRFPALAATRETLQEWRFYHQFRTDPESPMRSPQIGSRSPVLSHDGTNLASTWMTLAEAGRTADLDEAIESAFPGCEWRAVDDKDQFQIQLLRPGLRRWLEASELSDGTLRYFCLCAALLTPRPPSLLVFNEPETSLHPGLLRPLAEVIGRVSRETQIIIVTHSEVLAELIADRGEGKVRRLVTYEGETRLEEHGGSRRVWTFDD